MPEKDPAWIEAEEAAEDLTIANARLKRESQVQQTELQHLRFENKRLNDANAELLGEHGVDNAKKVIADMRFAQEQEARLREVINCIVHEIPAEFFDG